VKNRYSIEIGSLIFLILIGALVGFVPRGYAQSVQEWSEPINLSMSGAASNPSLVVDSRGVLHVIWVDQFDGYQYVESVDGTAWTSPKAVKFPFSSEASPPLFLTDAKGLIHIFWLSDTNELSYAQTLGENLDSPSAWRIRVRLDSSVYDFDASMDAQGRLHVGYVKNPDAVVGSPGVFYRRSSDGGVSWAGVTVLFESTYFRSLTPEDAHIRIAASENPEQEKVYVVWDDRPQKRIFMAISADSGANWDVVKEIITPQASLGFRTPYQADVDVLENEILLTWQVGEPGVQCTPYSQTSSDGGENWGVPIKILAESAQCPESREFVPIEPRFSMSLFTIQGDFAISAWNGSEWSNLEIQTGPSSITNPATFDPVLLGCKQAAHYKDRLFVVGCDQGAGGDIWFTARHLDPLEDLFPVPSAWSVDKNVTTVSQTITSLASVVDDAGNVHALWIQSPSLPTDPGEPGIEYARWNGKEWTSPVPVITGLNGLPLNLSLQIDSEQKLLLSWVDQESGELMFSWANSERANIPLEWMQPIILSSSSKLTNSPDMLIDASDRIILAYAITLNEERGIYVIQSTDLGETWSSPVRVFDGVSANWEMVDQPKLAVTEDGRLHILFVQYALLGNQQPVGLYYSQSVDGGNTWTTPEVVNEQSIQWSEVIAYKETLYRFWQEKNKSIISTYHQISSDGGITWGLPAKIPSDAAVISEPSVSVDGTGKLHLLQVTQEDVQILQEWEWGEGRWQLFETRKLGFQKQDYPLMVESGITSQGLIYILLQVENSLLGEEVENSLLSLSRSLELTEAALPFLASVSTPSTSSLPTATTDLQPPPIPTSPLANLEDPQPSINKNMIGLFLIVSIVSLILVFTVPRRNKATDETKRSK
jgi:hypothetical protein